MKKIGKLIKHAREGTLLDILRRYCIGKKKLYRIYAPLSKFQRIKDRKIVFCNFVGKGYGGDPKYIAEYIISNNLNFEMVWLVDKFACGISDLEHFPKCIKLVDLYSVKALYELSTAHFWIDNCRKFIYPPKKKKQVYIQTWHGTFPAKYIEKDAEETLDPVYVKAAKEDSRIIDYLLSGCKARTKIFRDSFYYDGTILEIGTPKEDIFFNQEYMKLLRKKVKNILDLPDNCKVILYAPTFRGDLRMDVYDMDYASVVDAFSSKLNCDCRLLVRFHPNIFEKTRNMEFSSKAKNVTDYPDMQELLCVADVIISDYSSTLDYSMFDKPVFLYCPDMVEYQSKDRGLYIKLEELPFPIATTNDEMIRNINSFENENYIKELRNTYKDLGLFEDGKACERLIQLMESLCKK